MNASTVAPAAGEANVRTGQVVLITLVATLGGFLFGFDTGVINGTIKGLESAFDSTAAGTGFAVSSMLIGSAIGALAAGRLADAFGRRTMLMVAAVFFVVSAWGSGIAGGTAEFIVYRLIGGLAVGAASVMAPAYIAEIAPAHLRGRLITINQIAIVAGFFFCFLSNYLLASASGGAEAAFWGGYATWRWMFWMELIPAGIFLFALFAIPMSPRYLVAAGKDLKAGRVIDRLFGPGHAEAKVADIRSSLASDHKPSFRDVVGPKLGLKPIVWVGIGLAVFQQLVGINVIFYYSAVLWESAGFSEQDALLQNVIMSVLSIIAVIGALSVIDRIGRKPLLFWGSIGMVITLAVMAYAFGTGELADPNDPSSIVLEPSMGRLALIAGISYATIFNASWGPAMWVALGEMFPNQLRGSGLAIAGLAQWLANFLISFSFPIFLTTIGLSVSYAIYATFAFISIFFVAKYVRETKGIELEEMPG